MLSGVQLSMTNIVQAERKQSLESHVNTSMCFVKDQKKSSYRKNDRKILATYIFQLLYIIGLIAYTVHV